MITIALTYRNRELSIVKNCLKSLSNQSNKNFKVVLVDYGSALKYKNELIKLLKTYSFVELINCETSQQLWCKSRAINIVLKQCDTPYIFVGDIDMRYHPEFIETLQTLKSQSVTTYFQVGFLNEQESKQKKDFNDYNIDFKSNEEATGMTLFSTKLLKSINGFDEYYNGWGSEDTDVHLRLKNAEHQVIYYSNRILMLHQWHAKQYRSKNDLTPFHTQLEQINASYLNFVKTSKKVKANTVFNWGEYNVADYTALKNIQETYNITNQKSEVYAFISAILLTEHKVVQVLVTPHIAHKSLKQKVKAVSGKKTISFLSFEQVNDTLLGCIINQLRDKAYQYQFNNDKEEIILTIKL